MKLNLKSAKENISDDGYAVIPEGRYDLIIESGAQKTSKAAGNPMLEVQFKILGPNFANRKVWHNFMLTDGSEKFLVFFLEAVGVKDLLEEDDVSTETILRSIIGKTVSAFNEPRDGRTNLKNWKESDTPDAASAPKEKAASNAGAAAPKKKLFA